MIQPVEGMPALPPVSPVPPLDGAAPTEKALGTTSDFVALLGDAVSGLSDQVNKSERMTEMAATGQLEDPTLALAEVERADLAFELAVQVRNRMVETWQELSRTGI